MKTKIQEQFRKLYGDGASLFASPGRVNLIGEHTDYNLGFVLPGAIDKAIYVAVKPNDGKVCRLHSVDYDETIEMDIHGGKPEKLWALFIYGVANEMEKRGALIRPFDMVFGGDVPLGAGLSSSAALESAVGFALNTIYDLGFGREQLAKIGQMTEHNYVGVRCGIMDQFASLFGEAGHVIRLDCRSNISSNLSIRRAARSYCSTRKSSTRWLRRNTTCAGHSARRAWPSCSSTWAAWSRCAT